MASRTLRDYSIFNELLMLISDRKFVTLCIGIGVMSLFVSHLKVAHFLRHTQSSNAFFVSIYSRFC